MPRFFKDFSGGENLVITGQDAVHIRRALRMRAGDTLTVCNGRGTDYFCQIEEGAAHLVGEETVSLKILYHTPTTCEPNLEVTLYQGLPKGDKMEWIIQKAVELGVARIVPVVTARSVVKLDDKESKVQKKQQRWQKISDEAAGQSGRGILPRIEVPMTWAQALQEMKEADILPITFYEGGGQPLRELLTKDLKQCAIIVGPEGGFESSEIEELTAIGAKTATLGPRILRCETAPLAALSIIMALTGNME